MRPPQKRNVRPAPDRKITDKKELSHLADGFGLDPEVEKWWAENAPEVEFGRTFATDDEEQAKREYRALERRRRAQHAWLVDNDFLAGDALTDALHFEEMEEREDRRREQMAREEQEDLRQELYAREERQDRWGR